MERKKENMKLPFGVAQGAVFYPYRISAALNDRDFFLCVEAEHAPTEVKILILCAVCRVAARHDSTLCPVAVVVPV